MVLRKPVGVGTGVRVYNLRRAGFRTCVKTYAVVYLEVIPSLIYNDD